MEKFDSDDRRGERSITTRKRDAGYSWALGYYDDNGYLYGCDTGNERRCT